MDDTNTDRLPPHSVEAEQGVIASILNDPERALSECQTRFKSGRNYFYDLRHQCLYRHLVDMHEAQVAITDITLFQRLRDAGQVDEAGGPAYFTELHNTEATAENLPHYLDILWAKYLLRRSIAVASKFISRAFDCGGEAEKLVLGLEADISAITEEQSSVGIEKPIKAVIRDVIDDMEQQHYTRGKSQIRGLPTMSEGNYLDKILRGIRETHYLVLAGRPGDGKTSFAMNMLEHLACDYVWHEPTGKTEKNADGVEVPERVERRGIPIAVFSIEMDAQSLGYRLLFSRANVDTAEYHQGFCAKEDHNHLVRASMEFSKAQVWVDDTPGQTIGQIAAKARRMARQYGIKLFVLDYLQLVELENSSGMDRVKELTKVSRKIMSLKKRLKVPWLVLAQMNRNIETSESKRPPVLSDLKDCGAIEQDADAVMFLYTPERLRRRQDHDNETDEQIIERVTRDWDWSKRPRRINMFVAKNRFGPVGTAQLVFSPNLQRFEDWHKWKVRHSVEGYKAGERAKSLALPPSEDLGIVD